MTPEAFLLKRVLAMGLTNSSVGMGAAKSGLNVTKRNNSDVIVALAGNPNVGKSTLFNAITGMRQHTGNWPGKTVTNAEGRRMYNGREYIFVDLPGCYSLMADSEDERAADEFICSGIPDVVAVVCGASCLQRGLTLLLQITEITDNVVLCVNLMDEAKAKGIRIDCVGLSKKLGIPVIPMCSGKKEGIAEFLAAVEKTAIDGGRVKYSIDYGEKITKAVSLSPKKGRKAIKAISEYDLSDPAVVYLQKENIDKNKASDIITEALALSAGELAKDTVFFNKKETNEFDRKMDRIFTGKLTAFPVMAVLLALVFWLTVSGANVPSEILSGFLFGLEDDIFKLLGAVGIDGKFADFLVNGVYRVPAWVVSVMLPPMAIFFPLFTILEDSGYLPRVAFNLDRCFKKCRACGKQALTMCMGFGCNAAGVTGCRIINSERERLVAVLTNSFVPCNGRFPTLITIITMFFACASAGGSIMSSVILSAVVILGIGVSFIVSAILTKTVLKGTPSSFVLELPPYRKPKIGEIVVRSVFDRTIFVLGRAICSAVPAGAIIWLMSNITIGDTTPLSMVSGFFDPIGRFMGLDGVILTAFILGFPANEIVVPIMIMAYTRSGLMQEASSLLQLKELLVANGWSWVTALCMIIFCLMHWPCATTLLTVKKETGSIKWTVAAFLVPTAAGFIICSLIAHIAAVF